MSYSFEEALELIEANNVNFTEFRWEDLSNFKIEKKLTCIQLERLVSALYNNLYVTSLDLSESGIGDEGTEMIARVDNEILERVILENCGIGPKGVKAFENNKTVTTLGVDENPIGLEGAKLAARNNTLKCLSAVKCQIGDEGARALWKNQNFKHLYLSENGITDTGLDGVESVNLITLYLNGNKITPIGAEKLAEAKIQSLHLSENALGDKGAEKFFDTTTIGFLNVPLNGISTPVGEELKQRAAKVSFLFRYHEDKKRKANDSTGDKETLSKRYVHV
jgi:hypothetical protein